MAPSGAAGVANVAILAIPSGSMLTVIANLEAARPGRRTDALHHAAIEDELYAVAVANGLVADDGERQTWATIRSGLGAGLRESIDVTPTTGRERYPSLSGAAHHQAAATLVDEAGCAATQ